MRFAFVLFLFLTACSRPDPRDANALHLNLSARIKTFDPILVNDVYSQTESSYVYEPLLEYHYLKRPYVLQPRLVESMPTLSRDGLTYTFRLRADLRFADDSAFPGGHGRAVNAEDVIYSWRRLADPKSAATSWWYLEGKIGGLDEWRAAAVRTGQADYSAPIPGLRAPDSRTLIVKLRAPSPTFLFALASLPTSIVAQEAVAHYGAEFALHPVGTGPYRLTEYVGSRLVFDRNPDFRIVPYPAEGAPGDAEAGLLADAGQKLPRNSRIVTNINEESLPSWLSLLAGHLDLSAVPKDSFGEALPLGKELSPDLKRKGLRALFFPVQDLTRVSFNLADPLFAKNKNLRQAMSLAFDSGPLIRAFYNDNAVPAQGPIPPGIPGYDPALRNPYRHYDLTRARALLQEAGYPEGKGLPILHFLGVANATSRQIGDYIGRQFMPLGIHVEADFYPWPEYIKRMLEHRGQLWSFGWVPNYPDAEIFLQLFYGKSFAPGPNDMSYRNPAFDALFEKASRELDSGRREALYRRLADLVIEDTPCIFLLHRTDVYLAQPWLKNLKLHNFAPDQAKYWRIQGRL